MRDLITIPEKVVTCIEKFFHNRIYIYLCVFGNEFVRDFFTLSHPKKIYRADFHS